jgi:hypothetical protein
MSSRFSKMTGANAGFVAYQSRDGPVLNIVQLPHIEEQFPNQSPGKALPALSPVGVKISIDFHALLK